VATPKPGAMECFTSAHYREILGMWRSEMKVKQADHETSDITFAGILVISLFIACVGIILVAFLVYT
jgi:hypothetical protein